MNVEPVYRNIKQNLGFREFLLRGKEKVKIKFNLVCIAQTSKEVYIIKLEVKGNNIRVDWSDTPDKTFLKYEVHASTEPGFLICEENRVASIEDSQLTESFYSAEKIGEYYFKVRTYYKDRFSDSEEKSVEVS